MAERSNTLGWLAWLGLALAVAQGACEADGPGGDDDDDDGSSTSSSAGTGGDGTGGSSSGTGGATSSGTGGSSSGSDLLYPLAVGHQWTYDVQAVGAVVVCQPGQYSSTVLGSSTLAGKTAFELTNWCTGVSGTDQVAPGVGDEVFFYYGGEWLTMIDPLLQEGHSWSYFNTSYTWHQESSVTVPLGTFTDCWTANQNVSYTAYLTYCRGVGLVRSYSQDLSGSGWDAQLAATNF